MNKYEAVRELMREYSSPRGSNTAAKRCAKAAKLLGLSAEETIHLMSFLDYCDWTGKPHGKWIRSWPEAPSVSRPHLSTPEK